MGIRTGFSSVVLVACTVSMGCTHAMQIRTDPDAEVSVDGKVVGTGTVTYQQPYGFPGATSITVRKDGRERTVSVPRDQLAWEGAAVATGASAGTCCALMAATGLVNLAVGGALTAIVAPMQCAACLGGLSGTGVGIASSFKSADSVTVLLDEHSASANPAQVTAGPPVPSEAGIVY